MRPPTWLAASLLLLAPGRALSEGGMPKERPLPVDKTVKLMDGTVTYTVEGRVRIPKGVEITLSNEIVVRAKGDGPAIIEVEGGLDAVGVRTREAIFDNVTVEPQARYDRIHFDMVIFRNGGGVKTKEGVPTEGYILAENFDLVGGAALDVVYKSGVIEMSSDCSDAPLRIRTVKPEGASKDKVRIFIRGCHQEPAHACTPHGGRVGFQGGMEVDGGDDVKIQLSRVGGELCAVRNWGEKLIFDGMKVNAAKLEFSHRASGQYQRVQLAKCDISSPEVVVTAPVDKARKDTLLMDRCWFKGIGFDGISDPKEIFAKIIKDGEDDPATNGVRVALNKPGTRPLQLAGPWDK